MEGRGPDLRTSFKCLPVAQHFFGAWGAVLNGIDIVTLNLVFIWPADLVLTPGLSTELFPLLDSKLSVQNPNSQSLGWGSGNVCDQQ